MTIATTIKFGDGLDVTDEGGGTIRVDGTGGPPGPPGPPGATYTHTQLTLAAVWNVAHGLGVYPSATVVDSGGTEMIPDLTYVDANNLTLTFGAPTSGKAFLN